MRFLFTMNRGENIRVIYDDPIFCLNLENDYQVRLITIKTYLILELRSFFPSVDDQGFQERPWSLDWLSFNNPTFGPREKVLSRTIIGEDVPLFYHEIAIEWSFGTPKNFSDLLGDRVREVVVEDGGSFRDGRVISQIDFAYDTS